MTDFEIVSNWVKGDNSIKMEELLWLKYQPFIKKVVYKQMRSYRIGASSLTEDFIQENYFQLKHCLHKVDLNKINDLFSFGAFFGMYVKTYTQRKVSKQYNTYAYEILQASDVYSSSLDRELHFFSVLDVDAQIIEEDCLRLLNVFKTQVSSLDANMLGMLQDNGVLYKDIARKLGYNSTPAFLYNMRKLKKNYILFMQNYGYLEELPVGEI